MINTTAEKLFDQAHPSAQRNVGPIVDAISPLLPSSGLVLEIASGGGYHSAVLADANPNLTWQPTDPDPDAQVRLTQTVSDAALPNLNAPLELNAEAKEWPVDSVAAVLCCNMIHIAPWSAAQGLFAGAERVLADGGVLFLYGPFKVGGTHTAPSNESFQGWLQNQNPAWGVRDAEAVDDLGAQAGLSLEQRIDMPANNMLRVYRRIL
ncbi:MAG: DUF938 domain-containing protein [Alphaproteobacteria bacterium]|nr:DUF938 domain-containing protein [Alphaproteobacteria bacterium]